MRTKNVYYAERPDRVIVTANGDTACVEMPVDITEIETEDGVQYHADTVYFIQTRNTPDLKQRVEHNYDAWIAVAQVIESPRTTVDDLVEAINALTDMVIGGMV